MARQGGAIAGGGFGGAVLDTLVVKIEVDLSGFSRGIAQAIAEVRSLKGAIAAQVGGVSLSDAMTAALVTPVIVATARLGQMRNELRALGVEMRAISTSAVASQLPAAVTAGAIAALPAAQMLEAHQTGRTRLPTNGRYASGWATDLTAGSTGLAALGGMTRAERREVARELARDELSDSVIARQGRGGADTDASGSAVYVPPMERRRQAREARRAARLGRGVTGAAAELGEQAINAAGGGPGGPWSRLAGQTGAAFGAGRASFPGFADAADNLGMSAHSVGQAGRRAAGGRIASMLGLVGLGALFGDLIKLAASLATVIGATLAGAFAALATPLGLVVVAITALVGLFVASNWDSFVRFGEWFGNRAKVLLGEGANDIAAGFRELMSALDELWMLIKAAFGVDDDSILHALQFFGEIALRVLNAVGEAVGGLLRILAELIRTATALFSRDWAGVWEHASRAVSQAVTAIKETFLSLFPELRQGWDDFFGWFEARARDAADLFGRLFRPSSGGGDDTIGGDRGDGTVRGGSGNDVLKQTSRRSRRPANDNEEDRLERLGRLADDFGYRISGAFEEAVVGGRKFGDVIKSLIADLLLMVLRMAVIEPMARGIADALRSVFDGGGKPSKGKGSSNGIASTIVSVIGDFFAGGFAEGGMIPAGKFGLVGENGPELIRGGRHGATIVPLTANSNRPGGMMIDARAYINAAGADPAAIARLEAAMARRDAQLPRQIEAGVWNMNKRGRAWA